MTEYFNSGLPISFISEAHFPNLHCNDQTRIYACNFDSPCEARTKKTYDEIIAKDVGDKDACDGVTAIEYYMINLPQTITSKEFIPELSKTNEIELFESLSI